MQGNPQIESFFNTKISTKKLWELMQSRQNN